MIMTKSAFRGTEVISLRNIKAAAPAPVVEQVDAYTIKVTEAGVKCGNHGRGARVHHANAASVRACYQLSAEMAAEQEAEAAIERAYERHLEDRGWYEAQLQDEMEARMGVYDPQGR
jgi:hypothetical protein